MENAKTPLMMFIALITLLAVLETSAYPGEERIMTFKTPQCQVISWVGNQTPELYVYYNEGYPADHQIFTAELKGTKIHVCVNQTNDVEISDGFLAVSGDGKLYKIDLHYINDDLWLKAKTWVKGIGYEAILLPVIALFLIFGLWLWNRQEKGEEEVEKG